MYIISYSCVFLSEAKDLLEEKLESLRREEFRKCQQLYFIELRRTFFYYML
jgi:hypothetical protein